MSTPRPVLLALVLLAGGAAVAPLSPAASSEPSLPGSTIVAVEGDARHGFSVLRLDGSSEHPPTLSESTAECHEYDDRIRVAACVAEVETSLEGLADVQLSLRWAQRQRDGR